MAVFKGIKTKIVNKAPGYWALVITDIEISKQVCRYSDEDNLVILAAMHSNGNWAVIDWRLTGYGPPSPWILDGGCEDSRFMPTEYVKSNKDNFLDKLKHYSIGSEKEISGGQHTQVLWPTFEGVVISQDEYDRYDPSNKHFIFGYQAARKTLADLKVFWSEFEGDSLDEAKILNPFYNSAELILEIDGIAVCSPPNISI